MPAKKRAAKRRIDPVAELEAWSTAFWCGHDYFGDLPEIGVPMNGRDPERAAAEEVWHRLGARYLATRDPREAYAPWALLEFGEPHAG